MAPSFVEWEVARQASVGVQVLLFVGVCLFIIGLVWFLYAWPRRKKDERKDSSE